MALTMVGRPVLIYGLGDVPEHFDPARLTRLEVGHGERWGVAEVFFPRAYAFDHDRASGDACRIVLDTDGTLLSGHVLDLRNTVMDGQDGCVMLVYDLRWDMSRMKVGQYGIGNLYTPGGGFTDVGLDVVFNPKGRGNRAAAPTAGVYDFSSTSTAAWWTRKQILQWLVHWYYPTLTLPATFPAAWDEAEMDLPMLLLPVNEAITAVCKRAGCSWALRYEVDVPHLVFVGPANGFTCALDLPAAEPSGAVASGATPYSVIDLDHETSIRDAVDVVEVRTARRVVEHTYTNKGENPLLISNTAEHAPPGFARIFRVDVTQYAGYHLGKPLAAGSLPKRWGRQLVTRSNDDGTAYLDPTDSDDALLIAAGRGRAIYPEEACWVNFDLSERKERVRSGIVLRLDDGIILVSNRVETEDATYDFNEGAAPDMNIWITLATEIEIPWVYETPAPVYHVDEDHPIRAVVQRADIQPQYRYAAVLPELLADNPDDVVTVEASGAALYNNVEDLVQKVHDAYYATRRYPEVLLRARLLDVPLVVLGAAVTVAPAAPYLTGQEIVMELSYNFQSGDHVTVTASNSIARAVAGEL